MDTERSFFPSSAQNNKVLIGTIGVGFVIRTLNSIDFYIDDCFIKAFIIKSYLTHLRNEM